MKKDRPEDNSTVCFTTGFLVLGKLSPSPSASLCPALSLCPSLALYPYSIYVYLQTNIPRPGMWESKGSISSRPPLTSTGLSSCPLAWSPESGWDRTRIPNQNHPGNLPKSPNQIQPYTPNPTATPWLDPALPSTGPGHALHR